MDEVGIRLNQKKPDIYFKIKKGGGVGFNSTLPLTHCDEKMVSKVMRLNVLTKKCYPKSTTYP